MILIQPESFREAMLARTIAHILRSGTIQWRAVEGVGFIRGNVFSSESEQVAIHVWDPSLHEPLLEDSGIIHDHRFAFRSAVLLGAVHDTEVTSLVPVEDDGEAYRIHTVTLEDERVVAKAANVRWALPPRYVVSEQPQRYRLVTSPHTYRAGTTFAYPAGRFHRAEVNELTVTLCWKGGDFGGGRLLARAGHPPLPLDAGIGLDKFTKDRINWLCEAAAAALESVDPLPYPRPWLPS